MKTRQKLRLEKKKRKAMMYNETLGSYPTDDEGFPIHPREVSSDFDDHTDSYWEAHNNHHLNFYRRCFGVTAISQTFRDLESFQVVMPRWKHQLLHDRYEGIDMPPFPNMMERIEKEKRARKPLKVRDEVNGGYVYHEIDDEKMAELKREFATLAAANFVVSRLVYRRT